MKVQDKAISLNAVITTIYDSSGNFKNDFDQGFFADKIRALPPVAPQRQTGHWIEHPKGIYTHLVCDKCLSNAPYNCRTNYCPNCGCRMAEPQERNDKE